jgi:hypothetical protein
LVAANEMPRYQLVAREDDWISRQGEYGRRVANVNMRDVLMITRPLAGSPISASLHTTRNRVRVVIVIERMFDAIQKYDCRLSRECAKDYHAKRGNRPCKPFGPQSVQTSDPFTPTNLSNAG